MDHMIFESLAEIDASARENIREGEELIEGLTAALDELASEMLQGSENRIEAELKKARSEEEAKARERIAKLREETAADLKALEKEFTDGRGEAEDLVFARITGL